MIEINREKENGKDFIYFIPILELSGVFSLVLSNMTQAFELQRGDGTKLTKIFKAFYVRSPLVIDVSPLSSTLIIKKKSVFPRVISYCLFD